MRRAAAQRVGSEMTLSMYSQDDSDNDSIRGAGSEDTDIMSLEKMKTRDEESDNESRFDRSYFRFDHEESDGGPDHEGHVGGRALDAVIVGFCRELDPMRVCLLP